MIELGALLGAMVLTLVALLSPVAEADSNWTRLAAILVLVPVGGAIWGGIIAALIHLATNRL